MSAASKKWLSLTQASDMLGVHPTTLRRWADNGDVPVYVTPGGHRRFLESDIADMIENRLSPHQEDAERLWARKALSTTKQRLQTDGTQMAWLDVFDEEQRLRQRELGQRLLELIMNHISRPVDDDSLLDEAQDIALRYAESCQSLGLTAAQCLEIVIFFRDSMSESALQLPQVASFDEDMLLRLMRKINQVFNLIQVTVVRQYNA
ncbi:MAG: helix-turn-helix domain-containing protein [Chloroflexi bacterium]|nr:helix-turn-helix domain-containing protein [Chloroflexota bacterium]